MPAVRRVEWTLVAPLLALVALAAVWGREIAGVVVAVVAVLLIAAVLAAVHHAEVVAHRVGEPYGSIVLAVAVTVIEVGLIVTLMLSSGDKASTLARDTVFAAVMITCNGIMGLSILLGSIKHEITHFNAEGPAGRWQRSSCWRAPVWCCRASRWGSQGRSSPARSWPSRPSPR